MQQQSLSVPKLTLLQVETSSDDEQQLLQQHLVAKETASILEQETRWQHEREYYHDQYLYVDRI